jgi:class 3 adenylate cyclase
MKSPELSGSYRKLECSLILVDLSGFTQLLYHASYKEEIMATVVRAMQRLFQDAMDASSSVKNIRIINTTGDGFIAIATGKTPSRSAVEYVQQVQKHFKHYVKAILHSVPFRQRTDLRIALHHGHVYEIEIRRGGGDTDHVYIGDDINMLARVINGQVARRYGISITRAFFRRLAMSKEAPPIPDEVILDRNRYPEQIEIYRMPETIKIIDKIGKGDEEKRPVA